jgi:lysophospholipase L1-like esterase
LEGGNDGRDQTTQTNTMNNVVANSAIHIITTSADPVYNHSNWNSVYGGDGSGTLYSTPHTYPLDGIVQNVYQWMYRQGDTAMISGGTGLVASAGADQDVYQINGGGIASLSASASYSSGTITSYTWSKVSGGSATITSPSSVNTTVTGLVSGSYVFEVSVTDNLGNTDNDDVIINVQAPPIVNAGSNQSISSGNTTLSASATDNSSVVRYQVTKLKTPTQGLRRIAVLGSSTSVPYTGGLYPTDSGWVNLLKNFYKGLGIIDTLYNLAQTSMDIYQAMPTGYTPPAGRNSPDPAHNITMALSESGVTDIIVNYPTNGYDYMTVTEIMNCIRTIRDAAAAQGVNIWFTTTQPRTTFSPTEQNYLIIDKDSILAEIPKNINFYDGMHPDGQATGFRKEFALGDGVHFNSNGQYQLFQKVVAANIFKDVITSSSVITTPTSPTTTITSIPSGVNYFLVSAWDDDSLANSSYLTVTQSGATSNCRVGAPVVYSLGYTDVGNKELYDPNGLLTAGIKGGDTIKFTMPYYSLISLGGIVGDATCPIVITNSAGVVVRDTVFRLSEFSTHPSAYVKVIGRSVGTDSGFVFGGDTTLNAFTPAFVHDFEYSNFEVANSSIGMYVKVTPNSSDPSTQYPAFQISNGYIHNINIHDCHGEGIYAGDTYPNADPYQGNVIPIRLDNIEIAFVTVDNTKWDGIQLSNARDNARIHDCHVTRFGQENVGGQQAGIILGGNTTGKVYNNYVGNGTGNGIQTFGYGVIQVYNNTMQDVGNDGTVNGQQSFFGNDFISTVEANPNKIDSVYGNTIINPFVGLGVLRDNADNGVTDHVYYLNNTFCFSSTPPVGWETTYLMSGAPVTRSGNIYQCPTQTNRFLYKGRIQLHQAW